MSHDSDRPLNSFLYDYKSAHYNRLDEYLSNIQWDILFFTSASVNDMWLNFLSVVTYGIESFVPKIKIIKSKKKYYPRFIKRMLVKKRNLWRIRFDLDGLTKYKA